MAKKDNPRKNKHGKHSKPKADKGPVFHHGSTTQGGSDYGQGSSYLGPESYKQGSTSNEGTTYEGERWVSDDVNDEPPPAPQKEC